MAIQDPIAVFDSERVQKARRKLEIRKRKFLAHYSKCGAIGESSRVAKVHPRTHYLWKKKDPLYAKLFKLARKAAFEVLELEARRRAVRGVEKPVVFMGQLQWTWIDKDGNYCQSTDPGARQVPLTITQYSDTLLSKLLSGHARYRDKVKELKHSGGVDHRHAHAHLHAKVDQKKNEAIAALDSLPPEIVQQIIKHMESKRLTASEDGNGQIG